MKHKEYLERRDHLEKIRDDSFDSFDKTILTLATGTLALSITFLDKIGRPTGTCTQILIIFTWLSLAVVLIANLLSFKFAQINMDKKIQELDKQYKKQITKKISVEKQEEKFFWQKRATEICNTISLIFFIIGMMSLLTYVITIQSYNINIDRRVKCPKKTINQK